MRLIRFARNEGLLRRFAPRNDIAKIYIAFILIQEFRAIRG